MLRVPQAWSYLGYLVHPKLVGLEYSDKTKSRSNISLGSFRKEHGDKNSKLV